MTAGLWYTRGKPGVLSRGVWVIGASEASPFLVFNVAILSVCLSVCMYVMDRHDNLLLGLMILYQLSRELHFYVNCCAWAISSK